MADASSSERDPVELLADEFMQRRRQGEQPTMREYIERYPQMADEIRQLFPALVLLEEAGPASGVKSPLKQGGTGGGQRGWIGDYRIVREIGRGGMGVVYEAEQQSLDRRVALKVLPWHAGADRTALERFRREARAAARLHHTNIVPVFEVGQEGETAFYAMQFIQGQSLDKILVELRLRAAALTAKHVAEERSGADGAASEAAADLAWSLWQPGGPAGAAGAVDEEPRDVGAPGVGEADSPTRSLVGSGTPAGPAPEPLAGSTAPPGREATQPIVWPAARRALVSEADRAHYFESAARIAQQAAEALDYAHSRGVVHRDVKPSNLLLDAAGVAWVTDFGLAKTGEGGLTRTGDVLGTLRYMAPERFAGEGDARADIYALGTTLYELLLLRPAFESTEGRELVERIRQTGPAPPRAIDARIPRDLERIVLKAMERDPRHRYASAAAMAEDLRRFVNDEPILARRVSTAERFARWVRRNRLVATATIAAGVLLLAAAVISSVASASFLSLAERERSARIETTGNLYRALVRQAEATRLARREGYRSEVLNLLGEARRLDTPALDVGELRREAVQALGDFVGLKPAVASGFAAPVRAVALDRTSSRLAVGLENGAIEWRDPRTGKRLAQETAHAAPIERLAFADDAGRLLSVDRGGVMKWWRTRANGRWQASDAGEVSGRVLAVTRSPEGHLLVAFRRDEEHTPLTILNLATGREHTVDPGLMVRGAAFSREGSMLAAVAGPDVYVWSVSTGAEIERITTELGTLVNVAFHPEGKLLLATCEEGLAIFQIPELGQQTFLRYDFIPAGDFSPDGSQVAFASQSRRISLWNVYGNQETAALTLPGWEDIGAVTFAADGRLLAAADAQSVRVWNLAGTPERQMLKGHLGAVAAAAFSPDGKRLATTGKDRAVVTWDTASGRQLAATKLAEAGEAVGYSADGRFVAAGDRGGYLAVLDAESLEPVLPLEHELGAIHAVGFSSDGRHFAACGAKGMWLWRVTAGEEAAGGVPPTLEPTAQLPGAAVALGFSPKGDFLAWADEAGGVHVYDVADGLVWPVRPPAMAHGARGLVFDATGERMLFVDRAGELVAWNVISDRTDERMGGGETPQGAQLALGGGRWLAADATAVQVGLWDTTTRLLLCVFTEERTAVSALGWSPGGRRLAVGTKDGGLALWNLSAVRSQLAKLDLDWNDEETAVEAEVGPRPTSPREALTAAIGEAPRAARLLARRGQISAQLGATEQALADLSAALEIDPKQAEALAARADIEAALGRWSAAADDCLAALKLAPGETERWYLAAALLARAGRAERYREHCRKLLARAGENPDAATAEKVTLVCLLLPGAVAVESLPRQGLETALAEGRIAGTAAGWCWATLAFAAHRAGDTGEALRLVRRAQDAPDYALTPELQALVFVVLALVQHESGTREVARESLAAARAFMERAPAPSGGVGEMMLVQRRLVFETLAREAEGRLSGRDRPQPPMRGHNIRIL